MLLLFKIWRQRSEKLLNCEIIPRGNIKRNEIFHFLWSRASNFDNRPGVPFSPNHFVPMFLVSEKHCGSSMEMEPKDKKLKLLQPKITSMFQNSLIGRVSSAPTPICSSSPTSTFSAFNQTVVSSPTPPLTSVDKKACVRKPYRCVKKTKPKMIQKKPILTTSEVNKYDIGLYYDRTDTLTDREVYDLIDNVWKPPQDFSLPSSNEFGKSKKFSIAWFDIYPWLTYSKYYDGCFCLVCVLFGRKTGQSDNKLTNLYKEPLTSWTHASERLKTHHSNSKLHKDAMVIMELFKQRMRNEFVPVDVLAYSVRQERIEKN